MDIMKVSQVWVESSANTYDVFFAVALIYLGANAGPGRLRGDYFAEVLAAAREWDLPREGQAALNALATSAPAATARSPGPR